MHIERKVVQKSHEVAGFLDQPCMGDHSSPARNLLTTFPCERAQETKKCQNTYTAHLFSLPLCFCLGCLRKNQVHDARVHSGYQDFEQKCSVPLFCGVDVVYSCPAHRKMAPCILLCSTLHEWFQKSKDLGGTCQLQYQHTWIAWCFSDYIFLQDARVEAFMQATSTISTHPKRSQPTKTLFLLPLLPVRFMQSIPTSKCHPSSPKDPFISSFDLRSIDYKLFTCLFAR